MSTEKLDMWALVELMGHQRIVGRITEQTIAGASMLRVDVPAADGTVAFTRWYGSSAIYAIHPVGEAEARVMAAQTDQEPAFAWSVQRLIAPPADGGEVAPDTDND